MQFLPGAQISLVTTKSFLLLSLAMGYPTYFAISTQIKMVDRTEIGETLTAIFSHVPTCPHDISKSFFQTTTPFWTEDARPRHKSRQVKSCPFSAFWCVGAFIQLLRPSLVPHQDAVNCAFQLSLMFLWLSRRYICHHAMGAHEEPSLQVLCSLWTSNSVIMSWKMFANEALCSASAVRAMLYRFYSTMQKCVFVSGSPSVWQCISEARSNFHWRRNV